MKKSIDPTNTNSRGRPGIVKTPEKKKKHIKQKPLDNPLRCGLHYGYHGMRNNIKCFSNLFTSIPRARTHTHPHCVDVQTRHALDKHTQRNTHVLKKRVEICSKYFLVMFSYKSIAFCVFEFCSLHCSVGSSASNSRTNYPYKMLGQKKKQWSISPNRFQTNLHHSRYRIRDNSQNQSPR